MFHTNQRIGPYVLLDKIGAGSFGEVWRGKRHDVKVAPEVAIKLPFDPSNLETMQREAELWVSASGHPNVVPVTEFSVYDGQAVMVSEYVAGGNLSEWLLKYGGKAPSVERAVEIGAGVLVSLHHLHTRKPHAIIHCDLKPENILMQGEIPRLTDFGIACFTKTTAFTKQFTGTVAYMSPEAFKGVYSVQRDIWAVGVILYQMLTGQLPFPQEDAPQVMAAILTEDPPPLPETIPAHVRGVVEKALCKDPAQRFASVEAMRAALLQTTCAPQAAALPSQTPTVDASAVVRPPPEPPVPSPVAVASQASSAAPSAAPQKTMDARAVPSATKGVKVTSRHLAKQETQQSNLRTLMALAGCGVLATILWAFFRPQSKPATSVTQSALTAPSDVVVQGSRLQRALARQQKATRQRWEAAKQRQRERQWELNRQQQLAAQRYRSSQAGGGFEGGQPSGYPPRRAYNGPAQPHLFRDSGSGGIPGDTFGGANRPYASQDQGGFGNSMGGGQSGFGRGGNPGLGAGGQVDLGQGGNPDLGRGGGAFGMGGTRSGLGSGGLQGGLGRGGFGSGGLGSGGQGNLVRGGGQ